MLSQVLKGLTAFSFSTVCRAKRTLSLLQWRSFLTVSFSEIFLYAIVLKLPILARILQFPVEQLDSDGFLCFKIFWITVNKAASKLLPPDTATQCCLASMELEVKFFAPRIEEFIWSRCSLMRKCLTCAYLWHFQYPDYKFYCFTIYFFFRV